ncbi:MAG: NAD(+) synthase, partial [Candidatus Marinimicrobia bacterium]|nr:NAD(+) synthase [Candidatus Neomarinimicrobiota bacterium]
MPLEKDISSWLKNYLLKNNLDSFVIGISGGIDSAVTSTLCAMTGCKTIVVTMPILQNLDETERGMAHCSWLLENYKDVETHNIDLTDIYNQFKETMPNQFNNPLALANTRSRIRMSTLYLIAGSSNGIVVGTGNKIEDFGVGFFTKYGDGGVDISPIADLMKSEVYAIGKKLKIIESILIA